VKPRFTVRPEAAGDEAAIRRVHELAFGRPDEAELVDALRAAAVPLVSLVAVLEAERELAGHVLFSPVSIAGDGEVPPRAAIALAPLAVVPGRQGQGIGSELARRGLEACRRLGHGAVFVVGNPAYYARFGFLPARPLGLRCAFDPEGVVFQVAPLEPGALAGLQGLVRYRPEFDRF
jgi:putative acetyltransferase